MRYKYRNVDSAEIILSYCVARRISAAGKWASIDDGKHSIPRVTNIRQPSSPFLPYPALASPSAHTHSFPPRHPPPQPRTKKCESDSK